MTKPVNRLPPIHPGEFLREGPEELGLSARALAAEIDVPPNRVAQSLRGERAITADIALRLTAYFGTSAEFWLDLQKACEFKMAEKLNGEKIRNTMKRRAA